MTLKNQQEMSSPTKNEHTAEADTSPKKSQKTKRWKYTEFLSQYLRL